MRAGSDWTANLLASPKTGWGKLPYLDTCSRRFWIRGQAAPGDLRGLTFESIDLSEVSGLADSCLDLCIFREVTLDSASLNGVSLRYAKFLEDCILDRVSLRHADLLRADCREVSLVGADLTNALIEGANFQGADLWGANLQGVVYDEERWWDFLCPERSRKGPSFGGDYQSPNYLNLRSGLHVIQYIAGENRRWSFGRKHPLLGWVWYMLANFGRSPTRLLFWVGVVWFLFAAIYASSALLNCVETSCLGDYLCCLDWLLPRIQWGNQAYPRHLVEPLYFSIVTLVGLGSEDIVPKSLIAQVYVALQGVLGYLMLAIFISVLLQDSGQTSGMPEQGRQPLFDDRDDRSNPSRHYGGPS